MLPDNLTKAEAANYLRISIRTLGSLIAKGELPAARIGTRVLITRAALEQFVASRTVAVSRIPALVPAWRKHDFLHTRAQ